MSQHTVVVWFYVGPWVWEAEGTIFQSQTLEIVVVRTWMIWNVLKVAPAGKKLCMSTPFRSAMHKWSFKPKINSTSTLAMIIRSTPHIKKHKVSCFWSGHEMNFLKRMEKARPMKLQAWKFWASLIETFTRHLHWSNELFKELGPKNTSCINSCSNGSIYFGCFFSFHLQRELEIRFKKKLGGP